MGKKNLLGAQMNMKLNTNKYQIKENETYSHGIKINALWTPELLKDSFILKAT